MKNRYEVRKIFNHGVEMISSLWDEPVKLMATDISPEGAFVVSDLALEEGEKVVVAFSFDRVQKEFCFFAEVARVSLNRRTSDLGMCGMGLRFLDAKPFERLTIRDALRSVPPPLPGCAKKEVRRPFLQLPVVWSCENG